MKTKTYFLSSVALLLLSLSVCQSVYSFAASVPALVQTPPEKHLKELSAILESAPDSLKNAKDFSALSLRIHRAVSRLNWIAEQLSVKMHGLSVEANELLTKNDRADLLRELELKADAKWIMYFNDNLLPHVSALKEVLNELPEEDLNGKLKWQTDHEFKKRLTDKANAALAEVSLFVRYYMTMSKNLYQPL